MEKLTPIASGVKISGIAEYNVEKTFDCGQCFRFDPVPHPKHKVHVGGVALGKLISVGQDREGEIFLYGVGEEDYPRFRRFLAIDEDYIKIRESVSSALPDSEGRAVMSRAAEISAGIRILRQDPWEALCSFIISQNNNIPRIKKLVKALCRQGGVRADTRVLSSPDSGYLPEDGEKLPEDAEDYYSFPPPESLVAMGEEGLFALRTGFRAGYLYDAAVKVSSGEVDLAEVAAASTYAEAEAILSRIRGVGPKVAACTLLFGFGRGDAFPVDVWIKRVVAEHFPAGLDPAAFGDFAGIAQQYLFYAGRYMWK